MSLHTLRPILALMATKDRLGLLAPRVQQVLKAPSVQQSIWMRIRATKGIWDPKVRKEYRVLQALLAPSVQPSTWRRRSRTNQWRYQGLPELQAPKGPPAQSDRLCI